MDIAFRFFVAFKYACLTGHVILVFLSIITPIYFLSFWRLSSKFPISTSKEFSILPPARVTTSNFLGAFLVSVSLNLCYILLAAIVNMVSNSRLVLATTTTTTIASSSAYATRGRFFPTSLNIFLNVHLVKYDSKEIFTYLGFIYFLNCTIPWDSVKCAFYIHRNFSLFYLRF